MNIFRVFPHQQCVDLFFDPDGCSVYAANKRGLNYCVDKIIQLSKDYLAQTLYKTGHFDELKFTDKIEMPAKRITASMGNHIDKLRKFAALIDGESCTFLSFEAKQDEKACKKLILERLRAAAVALDYDSIYVQDPQQLALAFS